MTPPLPPIDWLDLHARMQAATLLEARIATRLRSSDGLRTLDETTQDVRQLCELRGHIQAALLRALLEQRMADVRKGAPQALYNRDRGSST
jgi:hypothetical protein